MNNYSVKTFLDNFGHAFCSVSCNFILSVLFHLFHCITFSGCKRKTCVWKWKLQAEVADCKKFFQKCMSRRTGTKVTFDGDKKWKGKVVFVLKSRGTLLTWSNKYKLWQWSELDWMDLFQVPSCSYSKVTRKLFNDWLTMARFVKITEIHFHFDKISWN